MRLLIVSATSIFLLLLVVAWFLRTQQEQSNAVTMPVLDQNSEIQEDLPTATPDTTANIIVTKPDGNDEVSSPFTVSGEARVFENRFSYRLLTDDGTILEEGSTDAHAPDVGSFGKFTFTLTYSVLQLPQNGTLEVFSYSSKDGQEINKVVIPLRFTQKAQ